MKHERQRANIDHIVFYECNQHHNSNIKYSFNIFNQEFLIRIHEVNNPIYGNALPKHGRTMTIFSRRFCTMATSISKRGAVLKPWSCFNNYCERPWSLLWLIIQRKLSTKKWHYFLLLCTDILAQYEKMFKGTFLRKSAAFWPTFCGPCVPKLDNFLIELSQELSIRKWLSKDIGCFEGQESLNFFVKFSGNLVYRNLTTFCSNYHRPHLFWFSNNLACRTDSKKL